LTVRGHTSRAEQFRDHPPQEFEKTFGESSWKQCTLRGAHKNPRSPGAKKIRAS